MSSKNSNVVSFAQFAKELRKDKDGDTVDMMKTALDFHYEPGFDENNKPVAAETYLLEDIYEVMREAEEAGISKLDAIKTFLEEIIGANADEIEESIIAVSH